MLVPGLVAFGDPPDALTVKIQMLPTELAYGPNAMTRLVREYKRHVESPADPMRDG